MGSVNEILLQLEGKKSPFIHLMEGVAGGFGVAQNNALDNVKNLMAMEQQRQEMEYQAQRRAQLQVQQATEAATVKAHKGVGAPGTSPLPAGRLKQKTSIDSKGNVSDTYEVVEQQTDSIEKALMEKVNSGEMTLEQAIAAKTQGQGDSPSLRYQKEKDKKERIIPGYSSDGAVQVDDIEVRKLREGVAEFESFNETLKAYRGLIEKYGTSEHSDRAVQGQMEAYAKNLQLKVKNLAQLGVLSASDIPFIEEQVSGPGVFKTSAGSLGRLDTVSKIMRSSLEKKLKVSGYAKAGGNTPSAAGAPTAGGYLKTATNPKTGEKIGTRDGVTWEPLQ